MGSRKSFNPLYHHEKMQRLTYKAMENRDKDKVRFSREFIERIQKRCLENVKELIWY